MEQALSSFGPTVYAVAEGAGRVKNAVAEFGDSTIGWQVFGSGRRIERSHYTPYLKDPGLVNVFWHMNVSIYP